jgi:hypothetical protein
MMLKLTNENLDTLRTAAAPLDPRDPNAEDGQEPRQTFCVAPKIATIRLEFSVHPGNPG